MNRWTAVAPKVGKPALITFSWVRVAAPFRANESVLKLGPCSAWDSWWLWGGTLDFSWTMPKVRLLKIVQEITGVIFMPIFYRACTFVCGHSAAARREISPAPDAQGCF